MRITRALIPVLVLTALLLAACSAPAPASSVPPAPTVAPSSALTTATAVLATGAPSTATALASLVKPVPAEVSPASDSAPLRFSWQPVGGTSNYVLVVAEADPYRIVWFWVGKGTHATYGKMEYEETEPTPTPYPDVTPIPAKSTAPPLDAAKKYVWSILAYDSKNKILAATLLQPLPR